MTAPGRTITLAVCCDACERPAWAEAASLLNLVLGRHASVVVRHADQPEELMASDGDVAVASLLPAALQAGAPWAETRARWLGICAALQESALQESGAPAAFLCTVFRHVGADLAGAADLRVRIARLNLLAAQLSQETGISVIDLDRVLAHAGGRALGADARLASVAAARLAARSFAGVLLTCGLDHVLGDADREAAMAALQAHADAPAATIPGQPTLGAPIELNRVPRGGSRPQVFVSERALLDDRGAAGLLRDIRQRRITVAQAAPQLVEKVVRRSRFLIDRVRKR